MTAPTERSGGLDAKARGIAVLAVAAVVAFLLLWQGGGNGGDTKVAAVAPSTTVDTSGLTPETPTTSPSGGASTTPGTTTPGTVTTLAPTTSEPDPGSQTRPPAEVNALVLNGGGPIGAAAATTKVLGGAGYQTGSAANANDRTTATTQVFFAEGYEAEAKVVAQLLGKDASVVSAMPDPVPGPGADSANVLVVLGKDAAPTGGN